MKKAILFVHGLGGGDDTWGKFEQLINEDSELDWIPFFYKYATKIFNPSWLPFLNKSYGSITSLSKSLKTYIDTTLQNYDEILLVGHSLGGLIIRQYLLDIEYSSETNKIRKVLLYAVPNEGSELADIASFVSIKHAHLKELCRKSEFINYLNMQWANIGIEKKYEFKVVVAVEDECVKQKSALGNFKFTQATYISGFNHRTIVKPDSQDSIIFQLLKKFIICHPTIREFKPDQYDWIDEWTEHNEANKYFPDKERAEHIENIRGEIVNPKTAIRVIGLSGLGKTRLVLEALAGLPETIRQIVIYVDVTNNEKHVVENAKLWAKRKYRGIFVVDNCSVELHNSLYKIVASQNSNLSLITIDSDLKISGECRIIKLKRLDDENIRNILNSIFTEKIKDIQRVVSFAQGFPQMAILIANSRINEDPNIGHLSDDLIAHKLLWGDSKDINSNDEKILCGCALFDYFGLENKVAVDFKHIAKNVIDINESDFYDCIKRFYARGIIDIKGNYAQLVPKPLAIRLAAQWWSRTRPQDHLKLISELPESLIESFCNQIEKLDFLPKVKEFTNDLCGPTGPFGQKEMILSDRGSRLLRAFVNVNPEATSSALYKAICDLSYNQIYAIEGDVRRNIVWSLEKLCFHDHIFEESAWVLFRLSVSENESWSNNALGIFTQLYNIFLSGTNAPPSKRFSVLRRAINLKDNRVDYVVIKALSNAINTRGNTRSVGAEYQGTKLPLKEWKPTIWKEVFDYWQMSFNFLLEIMEHGTPQSNEVAHVIGDSIRGFIIRNRIDMLDNAIKVIVNKIGRYWPAALNSINNAIEYDQESLSEEAIEAIDKWKDILSPKYSNTIEKLQILVINPPWEHRELEDGRYEDVAATKAIELASDYIENIQELLDNIDVLFADQQKQSYVFGRELALKSKHFDKLIEESFAAIKRIDSPDISFLLGALTGVFYTSVEKWNKYIDLISKDNILSRYYVSFIKTGEINNNHLNFLLMQVENGVILPENIIHISYGSALNTLNSEVVTNFCKKLSEHGDMAAWSALDIYFMYCHGEKNVFLSTIDFAKEILLRIYLGRGIKRNINITDMHKWSSMTDKIISTLNDEDFATNICSHILKYSHQGYEYNDLWHYLKPTISKILAKYPKSSWSIFGASILSANDNQLYWIQQLLKYEDDFSEKKNGPIDNIPTDIIYDWCKHNGLKGAIFIADCINIFTNEGKKKFSSEKFIYLLENYGYDDDLCDAFASYLYTGSWTGSRVPYLTSDMEAILPLLEHDNQYVKKWATSQLHYLKSEIKRESDRDSEHELGIY